jgi:hypothetical protein
MPALPLALAAYKRSGFPEAVTVNCYSEQAPSKPSENTALIARPGLEALDTVGTAPTRAIFQKQGLFSDAALIVTNTQVYTLDSAGTSTLLTGTLTATGRVDIDAGLDADSNSIARVAVGSAMYKITDTAVMLEDFPYAGGAGASSVCYHKGYWIGVLADTDAVYYQIPAASSWNALQFASAEYAPDKLVAVRSFGELIALLGASSTEMWRATGDASSPLEPYGGMSYPIGCRARDSAVNCLGTLIWVTDTCAVVSTSGGEPNIISDHGLSEQIRKADAADLRASTFSQDQHIIYRLTLGADATWDYDLATQRWSRANSSGYDYCRAHLFANIGDAVLAADVLSNQIWRLAPDSSLDGSTTFTMEFTAFLEALQAPVPIATLELHCDVGSAPRTGQGSEPLIWVQVSVDEGKTWGPKKYRSLGETGKSRTRVRWVGLGTAPAPSGAAFRFGVSDPVVRRISGVWVNVP